MPSIHQKEVIKMFEIITNRFKKRPKVAGLVYGLENGDCLANGEI